jgi:phosphatidylinositol 3-kinase
LTLPVQTAYKPFKTGRSWQEWLTVPISYSDVPLSAQIALTVWDLSPTGGPGADGHAIPFGGTTIPLFDKDSTLQKGRQRCKIHRHVKADGSSNTTTPWIIPPPRGRDSNTWNNPVDEKVAQMQQLEALVKKHEMGEIPENRWLDQMVFRQIEKLERSMIHDVPRKQRQRSAQDPTNGNGNENGNIDESDEEFYLYIEFPRFDHPIIYTDTEYPAPPISNMQPLSASGEVRLKPPPEVSLGPGINVDENGNEYGDVGRLVRIYDPEVGMRDNPVESKHRRLVRSHRTGVLDRDLKPNAKIRDELNVGRVVVWVVTLIELCLLIMSR